MATGTIPNPNGDILIKKYDLDYSSISVSSGSSTSVSYSFPAETGYVRAFLTIQGISGTGTAQAIFTIHGTPSSGSIYIKSVDSAISASFTLRCFYIKAINMEYLN